MSGYFKYNISLDIFAEAVTDATNTKKATKRTKEVFMIDHKDDSEDLESHLKKTRAATCLSKAATNKYDKSRCLLPEDLHYNIDDLCRLFHRPDVLVIQVDCILYVFLVLFTIAIYSLLCIGIFILILLSSM